MGASMGIKKKRKKRGEIEEGKEGLSLVTKQ